MNLRLITAPETEPLTIAEAKSHLRLEIDDDDDTVARLITAARQFVESTCWRALLTQTWELALDGFPSWRTRSLTLPMGEVQSVESVLFDEMPGGTEQTFATNSFELKFGDQLRLVSGKDWPTTCYPTTPGAGLVRIRFVAGYGDDPEDVPQPIRQAMLLLISQWYENRTPVISGLMPAAVPMTVDALLAPYRLVQVR